MALLDLRLAVGPDDERRRRSQAPRDVLERLDRELGAVQLLEDEDERLLVAHARERAREELEDRRPVLGLRRANGGVRGCGSQLTDSRRHRKSEEVGGEVGEVGARRRARAGVPGSEVVLDQLAETLVREGAVLLDEAALQDADLPGAHEVRELLDEPALPDPRLARHDRELAFPGHRRVKPSLDLADLLLPPDERRRGRLRALDRPSPRQHDRARVLVLVYLGAIRAQRPARCPALRPFLRVLLRYGDGRLSSL